MSADSQGFYLGRLFDLKKAKVIGQQVTYDPADLTTHGVVVGMTGSGKTGLCIVLLEEAALRRIPAMMIDPKGDITNVLLHFPNLLPSDFLPWINVDQARSENKTPDQAAASAAELWRNGLKEWGIDASRISALQKAAGFVVYTPGSESGIPVSILGSLKAPNIPWEDNRELLRERISSTVTAILALVGIDEIDPVTSREHILLSNIFEVAWSNGRDLDLGEIIMQIQTPSFSKLGVFDVNTFFPEKDRFALAMRLNNILASPSFQPWTRGEPLDIGGLLYDSTGRPRHSVFYIAHLSDVERMFFVTLLYSAFETWMRSQPGSTALRALIYFDEIFGFIPPVANPPSKLPILRMLKQARAFGVGLLLATQNPVDLDYKGLSNAGTWFIGKLQTDQDKQRLLDGLEGVGPGLNRSQYDELISGIGKRVFLLHNVHAKQPLLMQTRWAMNYLAGPLTRAQIPQLNRLAGVSLKPELAQAAPTLASSAQSQLLGTTQMQPSLTKPAVPTGIREYFLANNLSLTEAAKVAVRVLPADARSPNLIYRPVLLAQAKVRFLERKYGLDYEQVRTAIVSNPDRRGVIQWTDFGSEGVEPEGLDSMPAPQASFVPLEAPLTDPKIMKTLEKDFQDWVYRSSQVSVRSNEKLQVYATPSVSQEDFAKQCTETAKRVREDEIEKAIASFDSKLNSLREKLRKEELELQMDKSEYDQRRVEELAKGADTILGILTGRRRDISTTVSKHRQAEKAKGDVDESVQSIDSMKSQVTELEQKKAQAEKEINDKWDRIINEVTEIKIFPLRKDVYLDYFGVGWSPSYVVQSGGETFELPAHGRSP